MYWDIKMTFTLAYFVSNPVKAEFFCEGLGGRGGVNRIYTT